MKKHYTTAEQAENRKIWIKALRSGKYKQAKAVLEDSTTGGMCCLGVACKVLGAQRTPSDGEIRYGKGSIGALPPGVQLALGFKTNSGDFSIGHRKLDNLVFSSLIELNDDKGWTFSEIADFVEKNEPSFIGRPER